MMQERKKGATRPLHKSEESRLKTFQAMWETMPFERQPENYTRGESVHLTLSPEWECEPDEVVLARAFSFGERGAEAVVLESRLGEGGMGEVWTGWQSSLGREVAVKRLKSSSKDGHLRAKLLREAWVTGLLEHPNIVPVHLLGLDAEGKPAFAMKCVQGVSWEELLAGKKELPKGLQGATKLERHLRILKQVCNAVHFAHSKGVIHRDIKPSNVMIGEFGEVYLMDWGIAVCEPRLCQESPFAVHQEKGIFGTPAYMAPEMTVAGESQITVCTDVYLLGATLHELLTGAPPHDGDSLYEVLFSATRSTLHDYSPVVPKELVDICHRAMHPEPTERFPTAEAFRQAIAGFLAHRASRELSSETMLRLLELKALVTMDVLPDETVLDVYQLFGEVRFGFQQAMRIFASNEQAQKGLQEALELMIQFELGQQNVIAASVLLAELPVENPSLQETCERVSQEIDEAQLELRQLKELRYETDLANESVSRGRLMLWMALFWGMIPLLIELSHDMGWLRVTPTREVAFGLVSLLGSAVCIAWWKSALWETEINRRLLSSLVVAFGSMFLLWVMCVRLQLSLPQSLALESIPMFGFFAYVALLIDRRLVPVLYLYAIVPCVSLLWVSLAPYATAIGNSLSFVYFGWLWSRSKTR